MQKKDFTVSIDATMLARYNELLAQYMEDDAIKTTDELEEVSATLEALADMGAEFHAT